MGMDGWVGRWVGGWVEGGMDGKEHILREGEFFTVISVV